MHKGNRKNFPPPDPKPYEFVSFPEEVKRERIIGHDEIEDLLTGKMICRIVVISPVHIGSGLIEFGESGSVIKGLIRSNDKPIIPGSSIKGVIRSIFEAISYSCVSKTSRQNEKHLPSQKLKECKDIEGACPTCRLFGMMGYLGRLTFSDAKLIKGSAQTQKIPPLYSPRGAKSPKNYFTNGKFKGRKFYLHGEPSSGREPVEVIAKNSVLEFEIEFENTSNSELYLLIKSMGAYDQLSIKLGGGKPVCLGSIKIMPIKFILNNNKAFLKYDYAENILEGDALSSFAKELSRHKDLLNEKAFEGLKSIFRASPERKCPEGIY
jgi:CRISPR/Cas system CSM-associated protein Csm3 (group 7 of RAMP superfamily)